MSIFFVMVVTIGLYFHFESQQVPVNQEILSRSRKSGSTGFETESDDNQKHEEVSKKF